MKSLIYKAIVHAKPIDTRRNQQSSKTTLYKTGEEGETMFVFSSMLILLALPNTYLVEGAKAKYTTFGCADGFRRPEGMNTKYCYAFGLGKSTWEGSVRKCREMAIGAHPVAIENAAEHKVVGTFLRDFVHSKSVFANCETEFPIIIVWTSGQRDNRDCSKKYFSWKLPGGDEHMDYTKWDVDQPDCAHGGETCVNLKANYDSKFNDLPCSETLCPLCQIERTD